MVSKLFLAKNFDSTITSLDAEFLSNQDYITLLDEINQDLDKYINYMENRCMREAIKHLFSISTKGNQLIQAKKPWELVKSGDEDKKLQAYTYR